MNRGGVIRRMDQRKRKLVTMHKALYPRDILPARELDQPQRLFSGLSGIRAERSILNGRLEAKRPKLWLDHLQVCELQH